MQEGGGRGVYGYSQDNNLSWKIFGAKGQVEFQEKSVPEECNSE